MFSGQKTQQHSQHVLPCLEHGTAIYGALVGLNPYPYIGQRIERDKEQAYEIKSLINIYCETVRYYQSHNQGIMQKIPLNHI